MIIPSIIFSIDFPSFVTLSNKDDVMLSIFGIIVLFVKFSAVSIIDRPASPNMSCRILVVFNWLSISVCVLFRMLGADCIIFTMLFMLWGIIIIQVTIITNSKINSVIAVDKTLWCLHPFLISFASILLHNGDNIYAKLMPYKNGFVVSSILKNEFSITSWFITIQTIMPTAVKHRINSISFCLLSSLNFMQSPQKIKLHYYVNSVVIRGSLY